MLQGPAALASELRESAWLLQQQLATQLGELMQLADAAATAAKAQQQQMGAQQKGSVVGPRADTAQAQDQEVSV